MRLLIFWDSITEWYYDFEKWGWANMLKVYLWQKNNWIDVGILGISWDEIPDILKRFDVNTKSFTEKYNDETAFIFAVWINDSVTNIDWTKNRSSLEKFEQNLEKLILKAKKYNPKFIKFIWLTNVNEKLVSPFPWSTTWKCYTNERIKKFDEILKKVSQKNECEYLEIFWIFENSDLEDWLHPNFKWHKKIFEKVKEFI
jgi:lysophospholipase L1-like esterase